MPVKPDPLQDLATLRGWLTIALDAVEARDRDLGLGLLHVITLALGADSHDAARRAVRGYGKPVVTRERFPVPDEATAGSMHVAALVPAKRKMGRQRKVLE